MKSLNTLETVSNHLLWSQITESIINLKREDLATSTSQHLWNDFLETIHQEIENYLCKSVIVYYHQLIQSGLNHLDIINLIKNNDFSKPFITQFSHVIHPIVIHVNHQIKHFQNFIANLNSDRLEIENKFNISSLDAIAKINFNLSDPHNNAETVCVLNFISGKKLVYKPRSAKAEITFFHFVKIINKNIIHKQYLPIFIDKNDYHWAEYIDHNFCLKEEEALEYHYRLGSLIALSFGLCAIDFHYENLISSGAFPVLIDLDSLLLPKLKSNSKKEYSVMQTGLLPTRLWNSVEGQFKDVSGIASNVSSEMSLFYLSDINQPNWILERSRPQLIYQKNRPLPGRYCATRYIENIKNGFKDTYNVFINIKNKHPNLENSPLKIFKNIKTRFIHRNTSEYERLRLGQLHPILNYDTQKREQYLLCLNHTPRLFSETPELIEAERQAISQMDIPYFWTYSHSLDLFYKTDKGSNKSCKNFFENNGYNALIERWRNKISENDLRRQLWFIESSLTVISNKLFSFAYNPFDIEKCTQVINYLIGLNSNEPTHWIDYCDKKMAFTEILDKTEVEKLNTLASYIKLHLQNKKQEENINLQLKYYPKIFEDNFDINQLISSNTLNLRDLQNIDKFISTTNSYKLHQIFNNSFEIIFNTPSNILLPKFDEGFIGLAYLTLRLNGAPSLFTENHGVLK